MSESNNGRLKAEEWFEKARHDFESAKLLIDNEGYPEYHGGIASAGGGKIFERVSDKRRLEIDQDA